MPLSPRRGRCSPTNWARSRSHGRTELAFRAVKPKYYPIPDDGPVGQLLTALGRNPYRPAHLHFILKAKGYKSQITHIFNPDDPYINSDAVFGVKRSLLASFKRITNPKLARELEFVGDFWDVEYDFVLASALSRI